MFRLNDVGSIRTLTASYGRYGDRGWNDKTVELNNLGQIFRLDARWTCVTMGVDVSGLDNVVDMLGKASSLDFAMHSFTNPIIDLDGDMATGHWLLWVAVKTGEKADQVFQSEELTCRRIAGGWRIRSIDLHFGSMLK